MLKSSLPYWLSFSKSMLSVDSTYHGDVCSLLSSVRSTDKVRVTCYRLYYLLVFYNRIGKYHEDKEKMAKRLGVSYETMKAASDILIKNKLIFKTYKETKEESNSFRYALYKAIELDDLTCDLAEDLTSIHECSSNSISNKNRLVFNYKIDFYKLYNIYNASKDEIKEKKQKKETKKKNQKESFSSSSPSLLLSSLHINSTEILCKSTENQYDTSRQNLTLSKMLKRYENIKYFNGKSTREIGSAYVAKDGRIYSKFHLSRKDDKGDSKGYVVSRKSLMVEGEHIVELFDIHASMLFCVSLLAFQNSGRYNIPSEQIKGFIEALFERDIYKDATRYTQLNRRRTKTAFNTYLCTRHKPSVASNDIYKNSDLLGIFIYLCETCNELCRYIDEDSKVNQIESTKDGRKNMIPKLIYDYRHLETELMTNCLVKYLDDKGIWCVTLHDAVYVKESDCKDELREELKDVFKKYIFAEYLNK